MLLFTVSCNSQQESNVLSTIQDNKRIDSSQLPVDSKSEKYVFHKMGTTDIDFLCDCDSLEFWKGKIQGAKESDSLGIYCMGQCATNLNFDIILFSKVALELKDCREWENKKNKRIYDSIPGVEYYVFEIPKTKSLEPENEFDTYNYVFPSEVKVYKKFEDGWFLIKKEKVNSIEQLGSLKAKTILKNN